MPVLLLLIGIWFLAWIYDLTARPALTGSDFLFLVSALILAFCALILVSWELYQTRRLKGLILGWWENIKIPKYIVPFAVLSLIIIIVGASLLYWALFIQDSPYAIAIVVGVLFASIGWLTTSFISIKNHIKQHTMNILLRVRESEIFSVHWRNIAAKYSVGVKVTPSELRHLIREYRQPIQPHPSTGQYLPRIYESIGYLLNYYEFMAVGIKHGDFHEKMLKDSQRAIVVGFCEKVAPFIERERRKEMRLKNTHDPEVFRELVKLYERWKIHR